MGQISVSQNVEKVILSPTIVITQKKVKNQKTLTLKGQVIKGFKS